MAKPMVKPEKARFDLRDIDAALFRFEGIHEGRWRVAVDLAVSTADVAPDSRGVLPSVVVTLHGLQLERCDDAADGTPHVFDAARENPAG